MKKRFALIHLLAFLTPCAFGQLVPDGGTMVINAVANTLSGDLIVGTNTGNTTLIITNGGQVNNANGRLGFNSGSSNNLVQVIGSGSVWSNSSNLFIGYSGPQNTLVVTNGGAVFCLGLTLGAVASSKGNHLQIAGTGSVCTSSGTVVLRIGSDLTIESGGQLNTGADIEIGSGVSTNILHVKGGSLIASNVLYLSSFSSLGNNRLIIESGGTVTNALGYIGFLQSCTNNLAVVTGPGSVWNCENGLIIGGSTNSLVISNSGRVQSNHGFSIGTNSTVVFPSAGNSIVVDGGLLSVFGSVNEPAAVGDDGSGNQLIVTNGGRVEIPSGLQTSIGKTAGSNNLVVVSGPGSVLISTTLPGGIMNIGGNTKVQNSQLLIENGGQVFIRLLRMLAGTNNSVVVRGPGSLLSSSNLQVGFGQGDNLSISNSGQVVVQVNLSLGLGSASSLAVSAANLAVTNAGGTSLFNVLRGTNLFDGGTILADNLRVTNGALGVFSFHSGTLQSGTTLVNNGSPFVVGDGLNVAVFQLPGGTHTFNQGLVISSNAILRGCGTVSGTVTVQPGGTVLSDCTNLVFTGTVTNQGALHALNGSTLRAQGLVVNQGVLDIIEGTTNFTGGFINNGVVLTPADVRISEVTVSGNDILMKLPSFIGHTFQLQRRDSLASGSWTNLAAQTGTGNLLMFTDTGSLTNSSARFYRIGLVP